MELKQYSSSANKIWLLNNGLAEDSEVIEEIDGIQLYFVTSGRNAWHSTWISRYQRKSMHSSLYSAQLYAESLRTNGSVFYIQVLPGIVLKTAQKSFIVTQINSENPLSNYRCVAERDIDWLGNSKNPRHLDCYMFEGGSVDYALETFNPYSRHWIKSQPKENSVMIFGPLASAFFGEVIENSFCKALKSRSTGKHEYLSWFNYDKKTSCLGVYDIFAHFDKTSEE